MSKRRNKIWIKISDLIKKLKHKKKVAKMKRLNEKIIMTKETDYDRWIRNEELQENWNERTAILAHYIEPNLKIIEFGAGNMYLKEYLNPKYYTPTDIVKRFDETIVCDLNSTIEINLSDFETAVFSGVLEYVHNIDNVFKQLNYFKVKQIVLSYCCSDINTASRELNGWFSDLSKTDIENIFNKYNYEIEDYKEWNQQSIYNLKFKI
jgi:hypothetical protein